jgi:amphi-Trp domain-containing protein
VSKEKVLFKSEEQREASEVAEFLRQLADRIEQRVVVLRKGDEEVILKLPPVFTLEVKAEEEISKKGKVEYSLEVELEWKPGDGKKQEKMTLG